MIQLPYPLLGAVAGAHALVLGLAGTAAGAGFDGDAGQRAMILLLTVIGAGAYGAADIRIGLLVHDEFLLKINLGSGFSMPDPTKIIQKISDANGGTFPCSATLSVKSARWP